MSGPRWEFHPYKTREKTTTRVQLSSSDRSTQSLLRLNLFTIGSFNELHFGPRRISGCCRPTGRRGNHAGALCRSATTRGKNYGCRLSSSSPPSTLFHRFIFRRTDVLVPLLFSNSSSKGEETNDLPRRSSTVDDNATSIT